MRRIDNLILLLVALCCMSCADTRPSTVQAEVDGDQNESKMMIARLGSGDEGFTEIRNLFQKNNPGYDLSFERQIESLPAENFHRTLFIQKGGGTASLSDKTTSKVAVGDIILLKPEVSMKVDSLVDILVFKVPEAPPDSIPAVIRPDWDPNITDVPGGCATETGAYRRILLTWMGHVGHYLYRAINAHRVRITDSFTHYHPRKNGFDEFYLVQMVQPDASIITGDHVDLVENPDKLERSQVNGLLDKTKLEVGDLVYLPRGIIHRGIGGVLTQVITVPGFIPGAEIGVDHHIKSINERFNLQTHEALPYNEEASLQAIVK